PFSQIHPACRDYLQAAAGLRDTWSQLVPEQIEARYHHDASLPAITDARDLDRCYQMKDLLVHPLTARRLLDEEPVDSATIRHELLEVIAHAGVLQVMTGG